MTKNTQKRGRPKLTDEEKAQRKAERAEEAQPDVVVVRPTTIIKFPQGRPKTANINDVNGVRTMFNRAGFNAPFEWILLYQKMTQMLDASMQNGDFVTAQKISESMTKKLSQAFDYLFPKIRGMDVGLSDLVAMEEQPRRIREKFEFEQDDDLIEALREDAQRNLEIQKKARAD